MSSRTLLCFLLLSVSGAGCGSGTASGPDPSVPACAVPVASSTPARDTELTVSMPAVAQMQATQSEAKVLPAQEEPFDPASKPTAMATVAAATAATGPRSSEFPDRQSIEALDRLARTVPIDVGKHAATITLSSDDYFDAGSAKLNESAHWRLDDIARALAAQSGRTIAIRVYTDALGDHAESTRLSQERAVALGDYFLARGAPADALRAEGMGPEHPVADNTTAAGRASNRRIEIVIEEDGSRRQRDDAASGAARERDSLHPGRSS